MERRDLIFMDAKSSKFWNIVLDGVSHTVTYGRTGTDGQTKTKEFDSEDKAKASFEKLVKQKMSKGYVEGGSDGGEEGDDLIPYLSFASVTKADDLDNNVKQFAGKRVVDYNMEKGPAKGGKSTYRIRTNWDDDDFHDQLQHFLDSDAAPEATGLVLGLWHTDPEPIKGVYERLLESKDRLPNLKALYIGDIVREENEMSWIEQSDVGPVLGAFPNLQVLRVRGGQGLAFSKPAHKNLRALAIETGGMSVSVVRSLCQSKFPNLEHLELWLGTEEYGGDSSVQDLQPLLSGKLFPKLKYLGFRNCDFADDIAGVVVNSPVIEQLETLDLSLGVITDTGAQALLSLPTECKLKNISIHHNFVTKPVVKKLKDLKISIDTSNPKHHDMDDEDWRFVAVGE